MNACAFSTRWQNDFIFLLIIPFFKFKVNTFPYKFLLSYQGGYLIDKESKSIEKRYPAAQRKPRGSNEQKKPVRRKRQVPFSAAAKKPRRNRTMEKEETAPAFGNTQKPKQTRHPHPHQKGTNPVLPHQIETESSLPPPTGNCSGLSQLINAQNRPSIFPPMVQNPSLPFLKETASFPRPAVKAPTIYLNPTEKDLPRFVAPNHDTKPSFYFPAHSAKSLTPRFVKNPQQKCAGMVSRPHKSPFFRVVFPHRFFYK